MATVQVKLTQKNSRRADELAQLTGKSVERLVNEAVERFMREVDEDEQHKFKQWREAMVAVAGIWKDRDDLPDFDEMRRSADREPWAT
jgi:predicted transcriptional regulator